MGYMGYTGYIRRRRTIAERTLSMTKERSGCTCRQRDLSPLTPALSLREIISRKVLCAPWTPETEKENTQHPTSNIEHPRTRLCAIIGCWAFDVGCWMFPRFRGRGIAECSPPPRSSLARGSRTARSSGTGKIPALQTSGLRLWTVSRRPRPRLGGSQLPVNPAFQRSQRAQPLVEPRRIDEPNPHHGEEHHQRGPE